MRRAPVPARLSRDELLGQLDTLTKSDSPYFGAIDELVKGIHDVFVAIVDRPGGFATTPDTVDEDVHNAIVDFHGDKLRQLAQTVEDLERGDPVPAIQTILASPERWKNWRKIFSFHYIKYTLTMIDAGRAKRSHVKQAVYKMIARRWGLSVVNETNGLKGNAPPPYTVYEPPARGVSLAQHLLNMAIFLVLQMVITAQRNNTRECAVQELLTDSQAFVNDQYKKKIRTSKKLNDIALQFDKAMGRAVRATATPAPETPAPVTPDEPIDTVSTASTANDLWCTRRFEYEISMRTALSQITPEGALRVYPQLQRIEEGTSAFRTPTHLDYQAKLQLPDAARWQVCVSTFRDPVLGWLDGEIRAAADAETHLVRLRDVLDESRAGGDVYAIQGLEGQIRLREVDVLERRRHASSWNSAFLIGDDRTEALRRLQLYEDNPILDRLIHATNEIFAAEHKVTKARVEVDLHLSWRASPQVASDVAMARQSLELMLGAERAAERIRDITVAAPEGTDQVLLVTLFEHENALEGAERAYEALIREHECFFVVNEVAARAIQEALRVGSLDPVAPYSPWGGENTVERPRAQESMRQDQAPLLSDSTSDSLSDSDGDGEVAPLAALAKRRRVRPNDRQPSATSSTGRRFIGVSPATMASIRMAVETWVNRPPRTSVRKLVAASNVSTSAPPEGSTPMPMPTLIPSVLDAERVLRQRLMALFLVQMEV